MAPVMDTAIVPGVNTSKVLVVEKRWGQYAQECQ